MTFVDQMATAISGAPLHVLTDLSRDIWKAFGKGLLGEDDAQGLAEAIREKQKVRAERASGQPSTGRSGIARPWSYFPPKRPQRSPDRYRSLQRRRLLAASSPMPPALAVHFTTGQLAALRIVADEVRERGQCLLTIPEIASRSGTSESTVRRAFKDASLPKDAYLPGLITVEERRVPYRPNLSNVVRIISREWLTWLNRRGRVSNVKGHGEQRFRERKTGIISNVTLSRKTLKELSTNAVGSRPSGIEKNAAQERLNALEAKPSPLPLLSTSALKAIGIAGRGGQNC